MKLDSEIELFNVNDDEKDQEQLQDDLDNDDGTTPNTKVVEITSQQLERLSILAKYGI